MEDQALAMIAEDKELNPNGRTLASLVEDVDDWEYGYSHNSYRPYYSQLPETTSSDIKNHTAGVDCIAIGKQAWSYCHGTFENDLEEDSRDTLTSSPMRDQYYGRPDWAIIYEDVDEDNRINDFSLLRPGEIVVLRDGSRHRAIVRAVVDENKDLHIHIIKWFYGMAYYFLI